MDDSFATPWTVACQAPLSMGFPRQEYWSGLPFPSPGDLPNPGIEPLSPALEGGFFTTEPPGKPAEKLVGFPSCSAVKRPHANAGDLVQSLGQEDTLRSKWQPTQVFLPGKSHGQRSLAGYGPWGSQRVRYD